MRILAALLALLALSACTTTEPAGTMAQTIELAAYSTAKRTLTENTSPERRADFQSSVDALNVLLSDWTPKPLTQDQLGLALSWMRILELRCATGAVIIIDGVYYEGLDKKRRRVKDSDLPMVASQVAAGLTRFLEITP